MGAQQPHHEREDGDRGIMDGVIILIAETPQRDEYGVYKQVETQRQVFCKVHSVTRNEFFGGGRNGLNPEYMFEVFCGDYADERICMYESKRYAIYRTFKADGDYIELYAQREGGVNGKTNQS